LTERTEISRSPSDTLALGERIGRAAQPGDVVALFGGLGAGKTLLAKGVLRGLGGDPDDATSPTFTLIRQYSARLTLYHMDAYRLTAPRQILEIGAEEAFEGEGVCLIEWADRVAEALPSDRLDLHLEVTGETQRDIRIAARGPRGERLLEGLDLK
jgi:tRNA threonylcarbamoyladenosine biosynthesis protein TsaE